jgi:hypothetical protein
MSVKIRRYIANQSNFLSTDPAPVTSYDIPRNVGYVDLTQSKVIFDMHVDVQDNGNNPISFPTSFGQGGQMIGPQCLIRNAKVVSTDHGLLNEQRQQNVLSANLDWYLKSRAREDADSAFGASTSRNYGIGRTDRLPDCPFVSYDGARPRDATATGTPVTQGCTRRRAEIAIPMKHIDQFASQMPQAPIIAFGDLSFQVEFETQIRCMYPATMPTQFERINDRAAVGNNLGGAGAPLITNRTITNFSRRPMTGDYVQLFFKETGNPCQVVNDTIAGVVQSGNNWQVTLTNGATTVGATSNCSSIHLYYGESVLPAYTVEDMASVGAEIGGPTTPLIIQDYFDNTNPTFALVDNDQISFAVGLPVVVTAQNNAINGAAAGYTTVSSLTRNGRDLAIVLTTPLNIGGGGTDLANLIRIAHRDFRTDNSTLFTGNWTIDETYLELHQIQLTPQQQEAARKALANLEIPYLETRLMQRNMPSTTVHTEVLQIDSNCLGFVTLSPLNLTFLSGYDNCTTYRYAIDGVPNTNRDIPVGNIDRAARQLHNHMQQKYFGNMSMNLNKYDAQTVDYHRIDDTATHAIYPLVTPLLPNPQIVQLQLFCANDPMTAKNLFFVTTHQRILKLSNGRLQIV